MKPKIHRPTDGDDTSLAETGGGSPNRDELKVRFHRVKQAGNTAGTLIGFFESGLISLCFPNGNDNEAEHVLVGESDDANNPNRINELATKIANGTVEEAILFLNECDPEALFELLIRIREIQPTYLQDILNELGDSNTQLKFYLIHTMHDPSWESIASDPQNPSEM
jgi:hypothetical protein